MSNINYTDSYGIWQVFTEDDEEGRRYKDLGIYEGCVSAIAFYLKDKCFYTLKFTPIFATPVGAYEFDYAGEVNISFDIKSKTWDMNKYERINFVKNLLKTEIRQDVDVEESNFYASVKLVGSVDESSDAYKKKKAIEKLTDEEKKLLGLM